MPQRSVAAAVHSVIAGDVMVAPYVSQCLPALQVSDTNLTKGTALLRRAPWQCCRRWWRLAAKCERRQGAAHQPGGRCATGITIVKTAPFSTPQAADIRPPCASTIEREIGRPIPIPSGLVV
jgi:hypothetical protein